MSLALSVPTVARAQDVPSIAQIEQAWKDGDLETVRAGLLARLETDQTAQTRLRLGRMLIEGIGGPVDAENGVRLLQAAAEQDHLPALTYLGRVFLTPGDTRDPVRAANLFRNAATRGDAEAKYYMGLMHKSGIGIVQDDGLAFTWLRAASEGGNGPAQFELSKLYAEGTGTAQNTAKAAQWLVEAAQSGVPEAQFAYANEVMTEKGAAAALPIFNSAAQSGFAPAQRALGTLYLTGAEGVDVDAQRAQGWLIAAARAGDVAAMNNLGLAYLSGAVLEQNVDDAVTLLERASEAGLARATFTLARINEEGASLPQDMNRAMQLYLKAVDQGSERARRRLGDLVLAEQVPGDVPPHTAVPWVMALVATGTRPDALVWMEEQADAGIRTAQASLGAWLLTQDGAGARAIALIEAAAGAGHAPSQFQLGSALTTGAGTGQIDYVAAHAWLNIAATSGHEQAIAMRSSIAQLLTPEQVAEAHTITRSYFEAARP